MCIHKSKVKWEAYAATARGRGRSSLDTFVFEPVVDICNPLPGDTGHCNTQADHSLPSSGTYLSTNPVNGWINSWVGWPPAVTVILKRRPAAWEAGTLHSHHGGGIYLGI